MSVSRVEYRPQIEDALDAAGIPLAKGPGDLSYMLQVDIGSWKGKGRCGALRSVRYTLTYAVVPTARTTETRTKGVLGVLFGGTEFGSRGRRALEMIGRGWDGSCSNNVFNVMSRELATQMAGTVKVIDPEERILEEDPRFVAPRRGWRHPEHEPDSDRYYVDRRDCMEEADTGRRTSAGMVYDRERFDVCMKAAGWRPE